MGENTKMSIMKYSYQEKCSFLVSSCDKYRTAWYPLFSLIKIYWPNSPIKKYLITERLNFHLEGIDVQVLNNKKGSAWGENLLSALKVIDTEYVIFSLEDFFLVDYVKDDIIEKCVKWMDENPNIAQIRLKPSSDAVNLRMAEKYEGFRIAEDSMPYRIDTQVAIWRKNRMKELTNAQETAWRFESRGTKRAIGSPYLFLCAYLEDMHDVSKMVYPYYLDPENYFRRGYSIAWGKWLWNNKNLFDKNGIYGVNYKELGMMTQKQTERAIKYFHDFHADNASFIDKIVHLFYKVGLVVESGVKEVKINGFDGIKILIRKLCKRAKGNRLYNI